MRTRCSSDAALLLFPSGPTDPPEGPGAAAAAVKPKVSGASSEAETPEDFRTFQSLMWTRGYNQLFGLEAGSRADGGLKD